MYGLLTSDVESYDRLDTRHMGHETSHRVQDLNNGSRKLYGVQLPFSKAFCTGQWSGFVVEGRWVW